MLSVLWIEWDSSQGKVYETSPFYNTALRIKPNFCSVCCFLNMSLGIHFRLVFICLIHEAFQHGIPQPTLDGRLICKAVKKRNNRRFRLVNVDQGNIGVQTPKAEKGDSGKVLFNSFQHMISRLHNLKFLVKRFSNFFQQFLCC